MHSNAKYQLWGEMPESKSDNRRLSAAERELLAKNPRPLTLEGPRIHQPRLLEPSTSTASVKSEFPPPNPCNLAEGYVTHGMRLMSYASELQRIKDAALARRERGMPPLTEPIPPMPSLIAPNTNPVHLGPFTSRESTRPLISTDPIPAVNSRTARRALKKSVAALCAFHGFDLATDSSLDVLTVMSQIRIVHKTSRPKLRILFILQDAAGQYLEKFCRLLRAARDNELIQGNNCGFPDPVCRVYDEIGIGSILNVRTYYQNVIVNRHKAIAETVESLAHECQNLDEVPTFSVGENGSLEDNIPEIHFPSSEEGDNGSSGPPTLSLDHNAPQIETGLQMLQSLEQGAYGNLDSHPNAGGVSTPPPASAHSGMGDEDNMQQPMSHDSNAALLLATVSPGSSASTRKRRKTSDKSFF